MFNYRSLLWTNCLQTQKTGNSRLHQFLMQWIFSIASVYAKIRRTAFNQITSARKSSHISDAILFYGVFTRSNIEAEAWFTMLTFLVCVFRLRVWCLIVCQRFFVPLSSVGGTLSVLINFPVYCISVNLPLCQYLVLLFSQYFAVWISRVPIFMGLGDVADHWREF